MPHESDHPSYAEDVYKRAARDRRTKWPTPNEASERLVPLCRPDHRPKFTIGADAKFFTIGSCFARHIETYLDKAGIYNIPHREFAHVQTMYWRTTPLNKYSPLSILSELKVSLDSSIKDDDERFFARLDDRCFDLLTSDSDLTDFETAVARRAAVRSLFAKIHEADAVVITLGQIEYWEDERSGLMFDRVLSPNVVHANPRRFIARTAGFQTCLDTMREVIELIRRDGPEKRILLTTSPVPRERTFIEQDAISAYVHAKSLLRVVAQQLADECPLTDYFPSYEMITMSDRRAVFTGDLIHVKDSAVADVMTQFISQYIDAPPETLGRIKARVEAAAWRAKGEYGKAFAALKGLLATGELEPGADADMALAAACVGAWEDAEEAVARLDRAASADEPRADSIVDALNRTIAATNGYRYHEAMARAFVVFHSYRDEMFEGSNDLVLLRAMEVLSTILHMPLFNLLTLQESRRLFDAAVETADDVANRKQLNELLGVSNALGGPDRHAELRIATDDYWRKHCRALMASFAQDARNAVRPIFEELGMTARVKIIDLAANVMETSPSPSDAIRVAPPE